MVQQNCTPENIYGPPTQTMFLGCSIQGFSATAGWNEQTSELTVELVQDTCTSPKRYWDATLTEGVWNAPDPGFVGITIPIVGAPAMFRFGNFEFSGLIQGWEEINAESGFPTFRVKLVDPRLILEKSQIIINEYSGGVGTLHNVINAFGYMETFGSNCQAYYQSVPGTYIPGNGNPDGAMFGSLAGAYGGADTNQNGTQWNQILAATRQLLCSLVPLSNDYSPYGRLAFKCPNSIGNGFGLMPSSGDGLAYYLLDLEEVPVAPSYWRFDGISMGVLEGISQICDDAGYDYYVELIPIVSGGQVFKFIKIRTVDRNASPANNSIDTFIANAGREVITFNRGRELRNEKNSTMVIGGPKQNYYQAFQSTSPGGGGPIGGNDESDDMIVPYFGIDPDTGNVYLPEKDSDGFWEVTIKAYDLALQLLQPRYGKAVPTTIKVTEQEMICAESGFDVWAAWASMSNSELYQAINVNEGKSIIDIEHFTKLFDDPAFDPDIDDIRAADFLALRRGIFPIHAENKDMEILQIAYAWIQKLTDEYYGKKFQVRVPFTCVRQDSESAQVLLSEEPVDGGWTEHTSVLGLVHPSTETDFFTLDDNRLGSFARFADSGGVESVNISEDDFIANTSNLWVRTSVESSYVYANATTYFSPRAIINLPQAIKVVPSIDDAEAQYGAIIAFLKNFGGAGFARGKEFVENSQKHVGNMLTHWALQTRSLMPNAVGFGVKSNILTYGPWASAGAVGQVEIIREEGLVPWEYGGYATMNLAGNATAAAGVTNQQVTEQGSITVAGMPELPIGAELLSADAGGPFSGGGNHLIENRSLNTSMSGAVSYAYTDNYLWSGAYGPNVTDMTVSANSSGFQTTYNIRIWSPKFGRFAKYNAERIKAIGKHRLEQQKAMRAFIRNRAASATVGKAYRSAAMKDRRIRFGKALNEGAHAAPKTPHEAFVGEYLNWNQGAYKRPNVNSSPSTELPVEFDGYDKKAIMSLDGLLRPISIAGSGGLPRFAQVIAGCQTTASAGAQPPTDKTGAAGSFLQYSGSVTNTYLNPVTNPLEGAAADKSDTVEIGHDIEMLAYGEEPPASSLIAPIQGYNDTDDLSQSHYADDYRLMALRGPIILAGWGYDLDSFPVPNKVDEPSSCRAGIFESENLQDKFMDDWLRKPDTWPVGPVDLRWDRARGVWTVPQFRAVEGYVKETGLGEYTIAQTSGPQLYDSAGNPFSAEFKVTTPVDQPLGSGDVIVADYDPQECKYRIIERPPRSKIRLFDVCCTGNLDQTFGDEASGYGIDTNEIIVGRGLTMSTGVGTDPIHPRIQINAKNSYSNVPCCTVPSDGYTRITSVQGIEHINFGAGLFAVKGTTQGQNGDTSTVCGFQEAACDDSECMLNVMAGFQVSNNHQASADWSQETLTVDGTKIFNHIDLQGGLRAIDAFNPCSMAIKAGIEVTKYTGCLVGLVHQQPNNINHKFNLGRGFQIYDENQNDGIVNLDAGFTIDSDPSCVNPDNITQPAMLNQYFNKIIFHKGTAYLRDQTDPCSLHLGAGVNFIFATGCVKSADVVPEVNLVNTVQVKEGLAFAPENAQQPQCGMALGVNMQIGNQRGAGFLVGDDFETLSPTDNTNNPLGLGCYAKLDLEDKFQEDYEITVINDVSTECCPSGGFSSITYETKTLKFNKKGLLITVTDGQEIVESCPCSGSGSGEDPDPSGNECECPEGTELINEETNEDGSITLTCQGPEVNGSTPEPVTIECPGTGEEQTVPCCLGTNGVDGSCVNITHDQCVEAGGAPLESIYDTCAEAVDGGACVSEPPPSGESGECGPCSETCEAFTVTLSGISEGNGYIHPQYGNYYSPCCLCSAANRTITLYKQPSESSCYYAGEFIPSTLVAQVQCGEIVNGSSTSMGCSNEVSMDLSISYNNDLSNPGIKIKLRMPVEHAVYELILPIGGWDCKSSITLPKVSEHIPGGNYACQGWPESVTIVPGCGGGGGGGFAMKTPAQDMDTYLVPDLRSMFIDDNIGLV